MTAPGDIYIFSMPDILAARSLAARTQASGLTRATAFLALILIPSLSWATIYKCTAEDGGITYTDAPCPADTTTQHIDPAAPARLIEYESQPEILAILCANDEFKVWLKAQRHGLPERDVRAAKYVRLSVLCRRALHLPDVAPPILQTPTKDLLGQGMPRPILTRN